MMVWVDMPTRQVVLADCTMTRLRGKNVIRMHPEGARALALNLIIAYGVCVESSRCNAKKNARTRARVKYFNKKKKVSA